MKDTTGFPVILRIRLFGPITVEINGKPIPPTRSRRGLWLLAMLALRANREVSRSWLAGSLWPDSDDGLALENLRRTLTDLRKALGPAAYRISSLQGHVLILRLDTTASDVLEFEAAIVENSIESLDKAVRLYSAPLLEDCYELWASTEQQIRHEAFLSAVESLSEKKRAVGEGAEVIGYLRKAISFEPSRESLTAELMRCLAENGDSAAAIEAFRSLRMYLRNDFNSEPSSEMSDLSLRLRSDCVKLKIRSKPSQHQPLLSAHSDSTSRHFHFPASSIPNALTELIGRESEVKAIDLCLRDANLLTLTGTGGIGKTRLAMEVAKQSIERFPDGVWFVELAALNDPLLLPKAIAAALRAPDENEKPLMETVIHFLRNRTLLLVLDNCEHMLTACAKMAGALLKECAELRILTTSRQALGITGEKIWRVPPLGFPPIQKEDAPSEPNAFEEMLGKYDALRLFYDRAKSVKPSFQFSSKDLRAACDICHRLDGIPLAIELAAVRVKSLSIEQIALRLDDRFRLLTGGSRNALPRQQTLKSLIDWSHDQLEPHERVVFRRLAIFSGGFSLEGAELVCSDEARDGIEKASDDNLKIDQLEVMDLLMQLVDKSLVIVEESSSGDIRYSMLETIRQYSRIQLANSEEFDMIAERHYSWYLQIVMRAEGEIRGKNQIKWLALLESEHENIRACLTWCRKNAESLESQKARNGALAELHMAGLIWRFWLTRSYLSEGLSWLTHVISITSDIPLTVAQKYLRGKVLNGAAGIAWRLLDIKLASLYLAAFSTLAEELGDQVSQATAHSGLGTLAYSQGDFSSARYNWEKSVGIRRELGLFQEMALSLNNLGALAFAEGDYARSRKCHEEALKVLRGINDTNGITASLTGLTNVAHGEGKLTEARAYCEESLALSRLIENWQDYSGELNNLAQIVLEQGDIEYAKSLSIESLTICEKIQDEKGIAHAFLLVAEIASRKEDEENMRQAALLLGASCGILRHLGVIPIPHDQNNIEECIKTTKGYLGEAEFNKLYALGLDLNRQRASELARQ